MKEDKKTIWLMIKELVPYILVVVFLIIIRIYIIVPIRVNGNSMQFTIENGDILLLQRFGYIKQFDVVVVNMGKKDIIKRVIAMPGDTIYCSDGNIYINGKISDDVYAVGLTPDFHEVTLAQDEYFVLGDNREDSYDSQEFGPIKKQQIEGKASLIVFPLKRMGKI